MIGQSFFNLFFPNAPFLYPLKTSKNRKVFWCFHGVEKGCIGNEWVKIEIVHITVCLKSLKKKFILYRESLSFVEDLELLDKLVFCNHYRRSFWFHTSSLYHGRIIEKDQRVLNPRDIQLNLCKIFHCNI